MGLAIISVIFVAIVLNLIKNHRDMRNDKPLIFAFKVLMTVLTILVFLAIVVFVAQTAFLAVAILF